MCVYVSLWCVCVCVYCASTHARTNPKQRCLEIVVKYLSFLAFPEDIIQETIKRKLSIELELL